MLLIFYIVFSWCVFSLQRKILICKVILILGFPNFWFTPFFRVPSQPRDQGQVSCIAGRFITIWATREAHWPNLVVLKPDGTSESSGLLLKNTDSLSPTQTYESECILMSTPGDADVASQFLTMHCDWEPLDGLHPWGDSQQHLHTLVQPLPKGTPAPLAPWWPAASLCAPSTLTLMFVVLPFLLRRNLRLRRQLQMHNLQL